MISELSQISKSLIDNFAVLRFRISPVTNYFAGSGPGLINPDLDFRLGSDHWFAIQLSPKSERKSNTVKLVYVFG